MKTLNVCLLLCMITAGVAGQNRYDYDYNYANAERYFLDIIPSDFKARINTDEKKKDFKELREYLREKEDLFQALNNQRLVLQQSVFRIADTVRLAKYSLQLKKIILKKEDDDKVTVLGELIQQYQQDGGNYNRTLEEVSLNVSKVKDIINYYDDLRKQIYQTTQRLAISEKNIKTIKQDIYECRNQIDSALAPEYKQQEFRITISICFAALIGILLSVFFFIVYKRSDENLSKELLSGNGLQFVTLFVLIIAIILFGILSILQGSELAAILSGISGYILGKGTQATKPDAQ